MSKWISNDKSVHIREYLAHKIIRYTNLGVIEADEFRIILGITNNQSVRKEREIIAIIMKIFAKESMVRQYQFPRLPCLVDLCFVIHKLIIEIDEDGHPYYKNDETRQKLKENLGFTFIRINPDSDPDASFDLDVEIAKIYNYINESSVKLAVNLAEKSLKEKFAKKLLNYISSISKPLKHIKYFFKKYTAYIVNMKKATIKNKTDKNW